MSIKSNIKYIQELKTAAAEKSGRSGSDVLLVAVLDEETAGEAAVGLAGMGIPEDKIIWTKPRCVI